MNSLLRILYLGDDPRDAELVQETLETEGCACQVTRVETQAEFCASLERDGFCLILADYTLPSFDGISALKIAVEKVPEVPFIFVSGTLDEDVAMEALKIGATDYVFKTRLSGIVPAVQRALRDGQERAERKRAQEALRQSEAYLAEAQRLSHSGSFGWRPASESLFWSEETFRIFQYERTTTPTVERILQRVHPEDAAFVEETIQRASQAGTDCDFEHRLLMPDGSVKHVHVVGHAQRDRSGELEFVGAVMDITASRRVEDTLRRSERYLAEAQRLAHMGSWVWRVPGREVVHLSEEWYRILGFDPDEGMPTWTERVQRIHPEDRARWLGTLDRAIAEESGYDLEFRILLPDGTVKYLHTVAHPVLNASGDLVEFVGSSTDITERKRTDEALRRSEADLNEAQRVSHTGSWRHDLVSGAVTISPEGFRIWGIGPDENASVTELFFGRMHPEDAPLVAQAYGAARLDKGEFLSDFRIVLPEGSVKHIHSVGHPILNEAGDVIEFVGAALDVTERKRAEEALRQAQADLAHVSRVTTMGELTASLSHEVKQPIAAAVTDANTSVRWLAHDPPNIDEARAAAQRAVEAGRRASDIISRIRLPFTKGAPQREWVDMNELIREMIVLLRSEAARYAVSVRTALDADLPPVLGDRVQLQQVLMNLIMNSIDAMKAVDGTRDLAITSQHGEHQQLLVSVDDTGVGLPPQRADQIFEAFFTTKDHGIGMGLSISRSIVESHGGRLWAAHHAPRGASFCLTLPTKVEGHE